MNLPEGARVDVAREKVTDYLLNRLHPDGAGKAAFFAAQGYTAEHWEELASVLKDVLLNCPMVREVDTPHGRKFVVDGVMSTPSGKSPTVRTVWIMERGEDALRLITAYPHEGDEDAERA